MRACAWVLRIDAGLVAEGKGQWREANRRFQASYDIHFGHGQQASMLDSLAGLLRAATAEDDRDSWQALGEDIRHRVETSGLDGIEHVGRLFVALVQAARSLGDDSTTTVLVREALDFVNERAARLADPAHRDSYVTRVPAHRALASLAVDLGVAPA